jgi:uncharacterized protein with ACT and thioredoxin-like domain
VSAQGIYTITAIDDEATFDNLCEVLEDYGVEIVAPTPFEFAQASVGETELVLAAPEDDLEELKEELETMDLLESVSIVDSYEEGFGDDEDDDFTEDSF